MRRVSLNARGMQDAASTDEVYAVLIEVAPPGGGQVIRLSTDPTERLSSDPVVYGTRSSWRGANPAAQPYLWVLASAQLPSDQEDAPAEGRLMLDGLDPALARLMRSYTGLAAVRLAVVLASSPSLVEAEWSGLTITSCEDAGGEVTIAFAREEVEQDHFPALRMTRDRFPALP